MSSAMSASQTSPLDRLADQYLNYLIVEKGLAAKTVDAYAGDLTTYLEFLRDLDIEIGSTPPYLCTPPPQDSRSKASRRPA